MKTPRTVVFVCLHGSAKSLIAAEYFGRLAAERGLDVHATSAGTEPDPDIPPHVTEELLRDGIDVRGRRPRLVTREELANASHVVSFGCDLSRLAPPGLAVERWDDVPAVSADFAAARDAIVARLRRLLADWESPKRAG
ncbi:MAG: protein tyrosine phosphatase [Candidatus Rokubacteria bacterium CSP1-6]|nr:MAG: protein tyrosine phosphatase [Candidatus Rokubacteria bacterium CSP1-6]